jgi:ParB/RepB/Spo0J family partition protein
MDHPASTRNLCWQTARSVNTVAMSTVAEIALDLILPSTANVRHGFDPERDEEDAMLLETVKQGGVLQPIQLRPHPTQSGMYEIIAGERRYLASKAAGKDGVLAIVDDTCTDIEARRRRFVENAARKNLSAYESCQAVADYIAAERQADPAVTQASLSERIGMNASSLRRTEAVWNNITPEAHEALREIRHVITWQDLYLIVKTKTPAEQMKAVAGIVRKLQADRDGSAPATPRKKRGSSSNAAPLAIYRKAIIPDMGGDPSAPRAPHLRLRPARSPGRPEMKMVLACNPRDLEPGSLPILLSTIRLQAEALIEALATQAQTPGEPKA